MTSYSPPKIDSKHPAHSFSLWGKKKKKLHGKLPMSSKSLGQWNLLCCFSNWQKFPASPVRGVVINSDDDGVLHPPKVHFSALLVNRFGSVSGRRIQNSTNFRWNLKYMGGHHRCTYRCSYRRQDISLKWVFQLYEWEVPVVRPFCFLQLNISPFSS